MEGAGMSLTNAYLVTTRNLEGFLNAIKSAKAPERMTNTFLKQLDYSSSNDRLFIGLLKGLGFTDEAGVPTKRYYDFLDQGQSGMILAESIREAYEDLFAVNKRANEMNVEDVKNKLRTLTQGQKSDKVLSLMANTFRALCDLADWEASPVVAVAAAVSEMESAAILQESVRVAEPKDFEPIKPLQLHYNIQIHLPESRDPAVFEAIFQALRRHLT
jgi:Family of unknown function (DUF5343)